MTIAPVDPGTLTIKDLEKLLEKSIPCESKEGGCSSSHQEPATWLTSHKGAKPSCTKLICAPCKDSIMTIIFISKMISRAKAVCAQCMEVVHVEDIILKPIGE